MNARIDRVCTLLVLTVLGCSAIVGVSTSLSAAAPKGADMKVSAKVEMPKIIAVRVSHDRCPFFRKSMPSSPS